MARLAFVFPGQGSQSVGMGIALGVAWPQAAVAFAEADAALGRPLSHLIAIGPADLLDRTENAQPALLATSIAFLRALETKARDAGVTLRPAFAAGHSMGQYSALVAAGALSFADGLRVVQERGRLMQASGEGRPGAMAAVMGLDEPALGEALIRGAAHGTVSIANRNAPGQFVISGDAAAIDAAVLAARELGARKCVILPVSVAAHSAFMADAAVQLDAALAEVQFSRPAVTLVANASGTPIVTADEARRELIEHLTTGVDWVASVRTMSEAGVDTFIEVGPGRVLTGLIKRIVPEATALALNDQTADDGLASAAVDAALNASADPAPTTTPSVASQPT